MLGPRKALSEIDTATAPVFETDRRDLVDSTHEAFVGVDRSAVTFMRSAGYRALVSAFGESYPQWTDENGTTHPAFGMTVQVRDDELIGSDLVADGVYRSGFVVIEANEQPGLANHEPRPTAQRFLSLLFPRDGVSDATRGRVNLS